MTWSSRNQSRPDACADRRARLSREFLDGTGVGYGLLEVRARAGEPVDARFVDLSAALANWLPLGDARGLWARHVLPSLGEEVYAMLRTVLVTGEAAQVELRSALTGEHAVKLDVCRLGLPKEGLVGVLVRGTTPNASTEGKG